MGPHFVMGPHFGVGLHLGFGPQFRGGTRIGDGTLYGDEAPFKRGTPAQGPPFGAEPYQEVEPHCGTPFHEQNKFKNKFVLLGSS